MPGQMVRSAAHMCLTAPHCALPSCPPSVRLMEIAALALQGIPTSLELALSAAISAKHDDVRDMLAAGIHDTCGDGQFRPDAYLLQKLHRCARVRGDRSQKALSTLLNGAHLLGCQSREIGPPAGCTGFFSSSPCCVWRKFHSAPSPPCPCCAPPPLSQPSAGTQPQLV